MGSPSTKTRPSPNQAELLTRKAAATKNIAERERLLRLAFDRELSNNDNERKRIRLDEIFKPLDERQRRELLAHLGQGGEETSGTDEIESIGDSHELSLHESHDGDGEEEMEMETNETLHLELTEAATAAASSSASLASDTDEVATQVSVETVEYIGDERSESQGSGSVSTTSRRRPRKLEVRQATVTSTTTTTTSKKNKKKKKPRKLEVRSQGSPG